MDNYKTYKKLDSSVTAQKRDETFVACLAEDIVGDSALVDEVLTDDMPEVVRRLKGLKERHEYALTFADNEQMAEEFAAEMDAVMRWIDMVTDKLGEVQEHLHKAIEMHRAGKLEFVPK